MNGQFFFQLMELSMILTAVVCGCCGLLCIVVLYLCVMVRRIRRELNELSRDPVYTDANGNAGKFKDEEKKKRNSSGAGRYAVDPCQAGKLVHRPGSLCQLAPEETVTVLQLERLSKEIPDPGTSSTFQEAGSSKQEFALQFDNGAYEPDGSQDHSSSLSSSEYRHTQPIYTNEEYDDEAERIYENNEPIDEPVYQNQGDLATFNNPERPRLQTMDINDI